MQRPLDSNDLSKYLQAFLRRRWFIILPTIVLGIGATLGSVMLPDSFRSTTLILVTPQKVPEKIVASTVTTDLQDRLSTITQQILSRTALEKVIDELALFAKEKRERIATEEIVELMRSRVLIQVEKGRTDRRGEAFRVAYVDKDPRVAQAVTQRLSGLFIEENLKVREQQAAGTSQFLADEIERYRAEVREKEQAIYEFKRRNLNEMTEQQAGNQARLTQLQTQLQINSQNMNATKDRKVLMQQQLAEIEKRVQEERDRSAADMAARRALAHEEGDGKETRALASREALPSEKELAARRDELARLRSAYTEKHPDVVRLTARVRQLEKDVAKEAVAYGSRNGGVAGSSRENEKRGKTSSGAGPNGRVEYPPIYEQLKMDIQRADLDVARLAKETEQLQRSVEIYQGRISAAPTRDLQMKQLSEGYNNVKAVLENLTDKKLQADLSENMERKQKGEQFRILDPPNLPERPISPNRMLWVFGGFLGGAAMGIGMVILLDFVFAGIRTREELEATLGLPVLGVIPEIPNPVVLLRNRKLKVWGAGGTCVALIAMAIVVHVLVRPLPSALADFTRRVQTTHWTASK